MSSPPFFSNFQAKFNPLESSEGPHNVHGVSGLVHWPQFLSFESQDKLLSEIDSQILLVNGGEKTDSLNQAMIFGVSNFPDWIQGVVDSIEAVSSCIFGDPVVSERQPMFNQVGYHRSHGCK